MRCARRQWNGFTLVEMLLVVTMISVLAAMVVPRFAGRTEQAKLARTRSDVAAIALALDLYEMDLGAYPESLDALVTRQESPWNGPYLKRGLPADPWGRPYQYRRGSQQARDYDLLSLGPDGRPGQDDITNWE